MIMIIVDCMIITYSIFDIFMLTYLANEIKLTSDRLSYCLFESNWFEQTQSCKKYILIVGERLKQPIELTVGKIFPLNMDTFMLVGKDDFRILSSLLIFNEQVVKRSYSLFNILQNLRK